MSARLGRSGRRWCLLVAVVCLGVGLSIVTGERSAHAQGGTVTNYTGTGISDPAEIATGSDGALWFTNSGNNSIGRITTTGTVTNYTGTGISTPNGVTPGPDGALWFTNIGNNSIGRITTTGTVTNYGDATIGEPADIATGPDGALWFTNFNNNSIGRITTTGTVTNYTGAGISNPDGITAGPDGALWFTNRGNSSIGRITTTGTVTNYTGTGIDAPLGITAGPDGALWFTNINNSIGRITTTGTVTNYTGTGIDGPTEITAGPDGALWFTNANNNTIGRIATTGTITNYTDPSISLPNGITAGPDGAVWFTSELNNSIGRITPVGATVSNVAFLGSSTAPQIVITGSGFGTAPPYPSSPAGCGYNGLDYGDYLSVTDNNLGWTAGQGSGSEAVCIGLVVTAWSDSQIVFGFGNAYLARGTWVLNAGDSYSLTAFATTVTGTVSYFPAPTLSLSPATGPAASAVVASGSSFSPGENVPVTYDTGLAAPKPTTVVLCIGIVAGDGSFTCYGHLPSTAQAGAAGKHKVTAKGFISGLTAKTHFKLT